MMSLTEEKSEKLKEIILKTDARRSFLANNQDLEKFLFSYFTKQIIKKESGDVPKKITRNKKVEASKKITSELKGYKIIKVSNKYTYPSTVYVKETPILCAESAVKGIIRKNKLSDSDNFSFSITNNTKTFTYAYNNKKLEANHGRK